MPELKIVKPHVSIMSNSSKKLSDIFDCASLKSTAIWAQVIPGELSTEALSLNKVCVDYYGNPLNGNEEGAQMPSIPSPSCAPVVNYSSSDNESVDAVFFQMRYSRQLSTNTCRYMNSTDCNSSFNSLVASVGGLEDSLSSAMSSITSSTNSVYTDSSNTSYTTVPKSTPTLGVVMAHQNT